MLTVLCINWSLFLFDVLVTLNFLTGEPFVNGEVAPYDEKYHADWLRDKSDDKRRTKTTPKKARRKRKKELPEDEGV